MSEFATSRFGWDAPSRIAGTSVMLQEQGALPVGLPMYSPLPFMPASSTSPSAVSGFTDDGYPIWQTTPTRVDLVIYQGDDVIIPLYFNNPDIVGDDLSHQDWFAQIRRGHRTSSTLVADFSVKATFHTSPTPGIDNPDVEDEYTQVEMYLPRALNDSWGSFEWEIASYGDTDLSRFPPPPGWDVATVWPPTDALKTWLFGRCYIVPRTTATDSLGSLTGSVLALNGLAIDSFGMLWSNGRSVKSVGTWVTP